MIISGAPGRPSKVFFRTGDRQRTRRPSPAFPEETGAVIFLNRWRDFPLEASITWIFP